LGYAFHLETALDTGMKKLKLLLSLITKDNDFQLLQATSAEAAAQNLGADLRTVYAQSDTITQSTQLLRAIQAEASLRPDAILVEPAGGTALPQVARAAVSAGIGWIALNCHPAYITELRTSARVPVFSVGSDHREIGRIQGRQYSALLPRGGGMLYIQGPSESFAAKERAAGMQSVLAPEIHVTNLRGQWTEESAHRCVASWLKLTIANKVKIDLIGAQNDSMAMGARKVFENLDNLDERERWLALPFTGADGVPKTGQVWVDSGALAATVVVSPNTGPAIRMVGEALEQGAKFPEQNFTPCESYPPMESLTPKLVQS
jgi:ribose transport system substrate-binding protein